MKCPKCQTELPDNAKFCMACGRSLQTELVCANCNHANPVTAKFCLQCGRSLAEPGVAPPVPPAQPPSIPTSFANGRYQVRKFLGEGGKKKVYLAHDAVLDRDVAFALIKTEKLDETARTRIKREAQAMGRLGDHPNIVTVFDFGDHEGQPYMVLPLLSGGDVEGLIKRAPDHKLPIDQSIEIAKSVCRGLQFAHAKGIIHRDIKPGNVWMTSDGTAKVGDFGLAVAVDRSRLTQVGMMVGTVSYMPPEQAMGGEVTAMADLYSLGAMLYEMVTGRPPFVGDDSVAIIGQHINTLPVSPTWHRADLPPALETLIMQLLEKDPEKRPGSAGVVFQALESIGSGKGQVPQPEAVPKENPLYRRVFVGREAELKQLQAAFDGAVSGQGALMTVLGEPGIGKTALCEQLATYVTLRGGRTLVGHCYEEGSLSFPYLAFVEAMRSYVLDRDAGDLKKELGAGATDVARIVSEIREKLDIKPRAAENPEEDRYRLFQSVTSFLANAASVKPLFVLLEDLHDADKATLEMLTFVSRNLSGARLLLVGTYRDVEVDRTHPLSAALAELRRVSNFGRVILRGLNADEVHRMLRSITHDEVPWSLAEAVHRQTEGNPLFVQEVVRYLTEQKLLVRAGGKMLTAGPTPIEMNIPEGLRDVIGKRVSLLSKDCNQLLSIASVVGREFNVVTLKTVAEMNADSFVTALDEAVHLSVLEERSQIGQVRYRFTHAFFRQTLYEEMIAPRRLQIHQQVARAVEAQFASRLDEHAAELAEHFSQSTDPADLQKSVTYGEMAARRAMAVYAYGEAVRLLDQATKVQTVLDPNAKARICDLLLELCDALLGVPDTKRILETEAKAAVALAESVNDRTRAARACKLALWAIGLEQAGTGFGGPQFAHWAEQADLHADPGTAERAYADFAMGCMKCQTMDPVSGHKLLLQAMDLARSLGDRDTYYSCGSMLLLYRTGPQHTTDRSQLAEELWMQSRTGVPGRAARVLAWIGDTFLALGQRQRAEQAFNELRVVVGHRPDDLLLKSISTVVDAAISLMDGNIEAAADVTEKTRVHAEVTGTITGTTAWTSWVQFRAGVYLGTPPEAPLSTAGVTRQLLLSLAHAYQGQKDEARQILDTLSKGSYGSISRGGSHVGWVNVIALEMAVTIGDHNVAESMLGILRDGALVTSGASFPTCIPRHLGGAAVLLGRHDEARQHYQEAIRVCTEMRFRPELALTRLQLAELLLDHFPAEKNDALEHLDFSIKEFREMKMQPSLERALRRKEILKA